MFNSILLILLKVTSARNSVDLEPELELALLVDGADAVEAERGFRHWKRVVLVRIAMKKTVWLLGEHLVVGLGLIQATVDGLQVILVQQFHEIITPLLPNSFLN